MSDRRIATLVVIVVVVVVLVIAIYFWGRRRHVQGKTIDFEFGDAERVQGVLPAQS